MSNHFTAVRQASRPAGQRWLAVDLLRFPGREPRDPEDVRRDEVCWTEKVLDHLIFNTERLRYHRNNKIAAVGLSLIDTLPALSSHS